MTDLAVPQDLEAEAAVVGAVVATHHALPYVVDVVARTDFYDPALGRAFAAAALLTELLIDRHRPPMPRLVRFGNEIAVHPWPVDEEAVRIGAVSVMAAVDLPRIRDLVAARPATNARSWALRVADAARRRQTMATAAEVYNALGRGEGLDDVLPLLAGVAS